MSTLGFALNIATKGMLTSQTALGTISHNLANTNTEGYVRQRVIQASDTAVGYGAGSSISEILRVIDEQLVERVTLQQSSLGYANARYEYLRELEAVFGSPTADTSLDKTLNDMFAQLNVLSNNSDSSSQKLNVVQTANFMADTIGDLANDIVAVQQVIDNEIDARIVNINSAIERVHDLNNEIAQLAIVARNGQNSNDLQDERRRQIDYIATELSISVSFDGDGRARITTDSGRRAVDNTYTQLERIPGPGFADIGPRPVNSDGNPGATVFPLLPDRLSGGGIKALVELRDTDLPALDAQIDNFASVLITQFNNLHGAGTGVPPQNSFTTGYGDRISAVGADLTLATELGLTPGSTFELSVIDSATGATISTTLAAGGGAGPIALPGAGPISIVDIANLINANPDIGALVTASATVDADGNPALNVTANNANHALVFKNDTGNFLGEIGMNNFFSGNDASDISVRSDILANPSLLATARMRESDGGLSFNDNRNVIDLAQMSDFEYAFAASGTLGAQNDSITGYFVTITSTFAVGLQDANSRADFGQTILDDMKNRFNSTSGVNMDEELSFLLIYQNAFQASARVISVVDQLLEEVVNII